MLSVGVCVHYVLCVKVGLYSQEDFRCRSMSSILLETFLFLLTAVYARLASQKLLVILLPQLSLFRRSLLDWESEPRSFGFSALPTEPSVLTGVPIMHLAPTITLLSL